MPGRSSIKDKSTTAMRYCFQVLVQRCGALGLSRTLPDQRERLIEAIQRGIKSHVLVITAGVSVVSTIWFRQTLRSLGAKIDIWRVAINRVNHFSSVKQRMCRFGLPEILYLAFVLFCVCASGDFENDGCYDLKLRQCRKTHRRSCDEGDRAH